MHIRTIAIVTLAFLDLGLLMVPYHSVIAGYTFSYQKVNLPGNDDKILMFSEDGGQTFESI